MKTNEIAIIAATLRAEFARSGGKTKSAKKSAAARENGKKGGRPKTKPLIAFSVLGFDLSRKIGGTIKVGCSACAALVINGTACHEAGCPNEKRECKGCNEIIPKNHLYCEDCRA